MDFKNQKVLSVKNLSKNFILNTSRKKIFQDISFDLKKGESLALIGINGSGKTTLLKILSQSLKPSEGLIEINGKIVSLIDAEGNFEGNLTGNQNARFFLEIHGMQKKMIEQCQDNIREFSGLGSAFFDPVKSYSKGMISRLLLAAALEIKADLYLIDEVFFAGDAEFIGKMEVKRKELSSEGISFIIATHNIKEVISFSDCCLWLQNDKSFKFGRTSEIVYSYIDYINQLNLMLKKKTMALEFAEKTEMRIFTPNLLEINTIEVIIHDKHTSYFEGFSVQLNLRGLLNKFKSYPSLILRSSKFDILAASSAANSIDWHELNDGENQFFFEFPAEQLIPGNYFLELVFSKIIDEDSPHLQEVYRIPQYFQLLVKEERKIVYGSDEQSIPINFKGKWKIK